MWEWINNPRLLACLILGLLLTWLGPPLARRFNAAWRARRAPPSRQSLSAHCPAGINLTDLQWQRLARQVARFIAHKRFIGCAGQTVDAEARLAAAVPACLFCLSGRESLPFPALLYVHLYPAALTPHARWPETELPPSKRRARWRRVGAKVVLAYHAGQREVFDFNGGRNAALFELIGAGAKRRGGEPLLHSRGAFGTWALLYSRRLSLTSHPTFGRREVLEAYAVTEPAVLFAAAAEGFFTESTSFAVEHPELHQAIGKLLGLSAS